jgi:crossover junction endonuclease MUS81
MDNTNTFHIKIDCREHDLIPLVKDKIGELSNISIDVESLPIGDIAFVSQNRELLIIERKKVSDLAASIKDGRYKEQSYRLDGHSIPNHNVMYIIEGNINYSRMDKSTMLSSVFSLNHYQGFSVWKTNSLADTAEFIVNSVKYMLKSKKEPYYNCNKLNEHVDTLPTGGSDTDYVNVVKTVKKDNVTPQNIGEIMLCQVPGVGAAAAIAIIQHFKSIVNLIADLQEQGESCFKNIEVTATSGKTKKLNKTCIANIIKYLDVQ